MLIEDEINSLCASGQLVLLLPAIPGLRRRRSVYLAKTLNVTLAVGPWSNRKDEERWGELRFWFDRFIDGGRIYLRERPRAKKSTADMAQLEPWSDEVWDVRSIDPKPSIRVLGS